MLSDNSRKDNQILHFVKLKCPLIIREWGSNTQIPLPLNCINHNFSKETKILWLCSETGTITTTSKPFISSTVPRVDNQMEKLSILATLSERNESCQLFSHILLSIHQSKVFLLQNYLFSSKYFTRSVRCKSILNFIQIILDTPSFQMLL